MAADRDAAQAEAPAEALALEYVLEKRRLRRSRFWWRLIAIFFMVGALGALLASGGGETAQEHIARFDVDGVIADDPKRDALLRDLSEDDNVKAVIVRINSPGGTTVGGEALYESLRALSEKKPTVAVMGEVAASAGYITALATDRIVARGNTITASIGVIFSSPNFAEALDSVGVRFIELKSGPRKAQPSPFQPVDETELFVERELIQDSFAWFIGLVEERREIDTATRSLIRDGRILSGRQALTAGLVDQLGGQSDAIDWLETERSVPEDLPVLVREVKEPPSGLIEQLVQSAMRAAGLDDLVSAPALWSGPRLISVIR